MRKPNTTWALLAAGTMLTMGAGWLGVTLLRQRLHRETSPETWNYFAGGDRLLVPLRESEVFTSFDIGYAGRPSPIAAEFLRVLGAGTAEEDLVDLVEHGAPGARLYGLCGLRMLGSRRQMVAASLIDRDDRDVGILEGCGLSVSRTGEAALNSKYRSVCDGLAAGYRDAVLPNKALNPTGLRPAG